MNARTIAFACFFFAFETAESQSVVTEQLSEAFTQSSSELRKIAGVRELPDGRTIAVDWRDNAAYIVDWQRGLTTAFGRKGRGPGEYRELGKLFALAGDTSVIEDPAARKYYWLYGTRIGTALNQNIRYTSDVAFSGVDRKGSYVELRPFNFGVSSVGGTPPIRAYADSLVVIRVSPRAGGSDKEDTIAKVRGSFAGDARLRKVVDGVPITYLAWSLLTAEDQAMLFEDGAIAVVTQNPFQVRWVVAGGRDIVGSPIAYERVKVDEIQKRAAINRMWGEKVGKLFKSDELPGWPTYLPPFLKDALLPLPNGMLSVERSINARQSRRQYDIINRQGVVVKRLMAPTDERIVGYSGKYVYTAFTDADELEWLRRRAFQSN